MKRIGIGLAALFGIALLAAGAWLWTPAGPKFEPAAAREAAAAYQARIVRDAFGVPHIYGARDADAAFGLAYAHASDDWATFAEVLRFSRGALAVENGKDAAVTDFLVAALGVWRDIDAKFDNDLSPETRAVLEAYAAGVNLWCADHAPRCRGLAPVSAKDIVAGFVARTPFFYGLEEELTKLFADDSEKRAALEGAREAAFRIPRSVEIGSNAMAVAPHRSADGHTRLMVNSHQPYTGPVAWYEARVKSEQGWDMIGGVFPGAPMILHGAGPHLGWAFTVNKPDLVDVFRLQVDDSKRPRSYIFDGAARPFERGKAKFRVKLFGPFSLPVTRETLRTPHGPVFVTPRGVFAVSYGGMGDIRAAEQWFRMNKARSFAEWRAAMEMQAIPSFNAVYADAGGKIGYFYNAAIPERAEGETGKGETDGSQSALLWRGVRPFGSAPQAVDPPSGYVINANNNPYESSAPEDSPRAEDYPDQLGIDMRTTNRGLRLRELFDVDPAITAEAFLDYKMDRLYSDKSRLVRLIEALLADEGARQDRELAEALELLRGWDRSAAMESRSAALAIRTGRLALGWYLAGEQAETPDPVAALKQAATELKAEFGRLDPLWSEAMRLQRGAQSFALHGAPETLRAVYPDEKTKRGRWVAAGGDTYILYADWPADGSAPEIRTIHQFGAATLDEASPHYADQAPLFVEERWKTPPMTPEALEAEKTAEITIGGRR